MTATIVEHDNRAPLDAGFAARLVDSMAEGSDVPSVGIAGDANAWTSRPAGQLWERVAEGEPTPTVRLNIALLQSYALQYIDGLRS